MPLPSEDMVVLARNPEEMAKAQTQLVTWAARKVLIEEAAQAEAEQNLEHAKNTKLRTSGWRNQVTKARKRVTFYKKIQTALEEGYRIVPNFPVTVIATRTSKEKPKYQRETWEGSLNMVQYEALPQGEGRYVDPTPVARKTVEKTGEGRTLTHYTAEGLNEEIDFPFKVVKPQILSNLNKAMTLKLFDEIGVLPGTRKGDPMVIGMINRRDSTYQETTVSFLITWWVDSRDL